MEKEFVGEEMESRLLAYFNGELDEDARRSVECWIEEKPENRETYKVFLRDYLHIRWVEKEASVNLERGKARLRHRMHGAKMRRIYYRVAASIVILFSLGEVYLFHISKQEDAIVYGTENIRPGSPQARLILSSGEVVDLTQDREMIREQDGSFVKIKEKKGLVYDTADASSNTEQVLYHTVIVPRGGEFFVTLTDGTEVWLNADSELRYPVRFTNESREVWLRGEAYFIVSKDSLKSFVVHSGDYRLRVYGTEFNLNAYRAEGIQAVLVKGSVGFRANGAVVEKPLKPNQLAVTNVFTGDSEITDVDVTPYVAWKNRNLVFVNERLESILDKAARWYDVNVSYRNESLKEVRFYGNMPRYADIEELLSLLEKASDVRFVIKGRTVTVGGK